METSYIAIDIETTGLSPLKDRIIEIGAAKVANGEIVATFSELVDPKVKLSERIVELTGISDEMLLERRSIDEVIKDFILFAEELPLLGHNVIFDYSFLKVAAKKENMEFERNGIDTLQIAKVLHADLESRSLGALCEYYQITNEKQHRAYYDAVSAKELYELLAKHSLANEKLLGSKPLFYRIPKIEPITNKQKNYLNDLMKYHKIESRQLIDKLTKSEASRMIDQIISQYGKM